MEGDKPTQLSALLQMEGRELQEHGRRMASCRVFSDYKSMSWKNGLGQSVELAVVPSPPPKLLRFFRSLANRLGGAVVSQTTQRAVLTRGPPSQVPPGCDFTVTPFLWRVSLTEVVGSTTFSLFHSYDRILLRYALTTPTRTQRAYGVGG
jgi:hypothetical protein